MAELININSAPAEELTALPGVGPALANRIVAARPFEEIDDLRLISGVGPALMERWASRITLTDPASPEEIIFLGGESETQPQAGESILETEAPSESESAPLPEEEPIPPWDQSVEEEESPAPEIPVPQENAIVPIHQEVREPTPKPAAAKSVTWGQVLTISGICSFAAFILAVLLTLGILSSLNDGLRFGSVEQVSALSNQVQSLNLEFEALSQDAAALQTRLDNLEGISSRVNDLESLADQLSADLDQTNTTLKDLDNQVEQIAESAKTFQSFLDGLRDLLDGLSEP